MIEKKIYYVWLGDAKKPDIFEKCLKSWEKNMSEYEIIEINETNFDIEKHKEKNLFFKTCYDKKMWAYVSDYIRIHHLYENGGIYLDTDMEIIKNIDPLINSPKIDFVSGYESDKFIAVGLFYAKKHSKVLESMIKFYDKKIWELPLFTIPKILTYVLEKEYNLSEKRENVLCDGEILLYDKTYFYPYPQNEVFNENMLTENSYAIHWWDNSWTNLQNMLFLETKHLKGISKIYKKLRIIARYYIKKQ